MSAETLTLELNVTPNQAYELAQFVKRLTSTEIRACAVDDDNAAVMTDAIHELSKALAHAGYAPR